MKLARAYKMNKSLLKTIRCLRQRQKDNNIFTWHHRRWIYTTVCSLTNSNQRRFNEINIQMLSQNLYEQIFNPGKDDKQSKNATYNGISSNQLNKIENHLKKFNLWDKEPTVLEDVDLKLPPLHGTDINEHFKFIAEKQTSEYKTLAGEIAEGSVPSLPSKWNFAKGWTKYNYDGSIEKVDYPDASCIVLDVECLIKEGNYPTLATAVSCSNWYSWCSGYLTEKKFIWSSEPNMKDLIPLGMKITDKQLVIGHNVSFDRSFVGEQYHFQGQKTKFLDTMSLHIAVSGFTNFQRLLKMSKDNNSERKEIQERLLKIKKFSEEWIDVGSMNGLSAVYQHYIGEKHLDKSGREVFISGTMTDVREQFQELMTYCARDVEATFRVFQVLWSEFLKRFPHPVTLAGMLEMGTAFLPINENWKRYIQQCNTCYSDLQSELKSTLMRLANEACELLEDDQYKDDPWLWDLDWTVNQYKLKKTAASHKRSSKQKEVSHSVPDVSTECKVPEYVDRDNFEGLEKYRQDCEAYMKDLRNRFWQAMDSNFDRSKEEQLSSVVANVYNSAGRIPKIETHMAGYPLWYRELCPRPNDDDWYPGPSSISIQTRVTPKLMRLTWDGYPLHYNDTHGWGYLVPGKKINNHFDDDTAEESDAFPHRFLADFCSRVSKVTSNVEASGLHKAVDSSGRMNDILLEQSDMSAEEMDSHWSEFHKKQGNITRTLIVSQEYIPIMQREMKRKQQIHDELQIDEMKSGASHAFTITGKKSEVELIYRQLLNFYKQMRQDVPDFHQGDGPYNDVDLPGCWFFKVPHKDGKGKRVGNPLAKDFLFKVEEGILQTWSGTSADRALKLSKMCSYWKNNQQRIESQMAVWLKKNELPKPVTSNLDYYEDGVYGAIIPRVITAGTVTRRAVEATWQTASNAYVDRIGSELKAMVQTPPGYHFIGADVDSQELWISALIGDSHFEKLHGCSAFGWMVLQGKKSVNTDLHSKTAEVVGVSRDHAKIFNYGRIYGAGITFAQRLLMQFNHRMSSEEARQKAVKMYSATKGQVRMKKWEGGSESYMFNKLEEIAKSKEPRTPVLECRISKALEPDKVKEGFMTSRINWVVQSSAVDYLHLMLVCMRWLFEQYGIDGRFCISIHDEVRYMVKSEDRYRAALALQITNLLTRCMFSYRLGIKDLPQSVAFFSSVDIDVCLRKEVGLDCKTPSNPHGLHRGYNIPTGESLDIYQVIEKTNGKLK